MIFKNKFLYKKAISLFLISLMFDTAVFTTRTVADDKGDEQNEAIRALILAGIIPDYLSNLSNAASCGAGEKEDDKPTVVAYTCSCMTPAELKDASVQAASAGDVTGTPASGSGTSATTTAATTTPSSTSATANPVVSGPSTLAPPKVNQWTIDLTAMNAHPAMSLKDLTKTQDDKYFGNGSGHVVSDQVKLSKTKGPTTLTLTLKSDLYLKDLYGKDAYENETERSNVQFLDATRIEANIKQYIKEGKPIYITGGVGYETRQSDVSKNTYALNQYNDGKNNIVGSQGQNSFYKFQADPNSDPIYYILDKDQNVIGQTDKAPQNGILLQNWVDPLNSPYANTVVTATAGVGAKYKIPLGFKCQGSTQVGAEYDINADKNVKGSRIDPNSHLYLNQTLKVDIGSTRKNGNTGRVAFTGSTMVFYFPKGPSQGLGAQNEIKFQTNHYLGRSLASPSISVSIPVGSEMFQGIEFNKSPRITGGFTLTLPGSKRKKHTD